MELDTLLKSVQSRQADFRYGIGTAAQYLKGIAPCFGEGGLCPVKTFNIASRGEWQKALDEASGRLTWCDERAGMLTTKFQHPSTMDLEAYPKAIAIFDHVLATSDEDNEGDIFCTAGADLDPRMPLLWQHVPMSPVGRLVKVLDHNDKLLHVKSIILDTDLGRDAAVLLEGGALRFSHGFLPSKFEPGKKGIDGSGCERWKILSSKVLEESLVSIPANSDAVLTAFSRKQLHSPLVKAWAGAMHDARPAMVNIPLDMKALAAGQQLDISIKATPPANTGSDVTTGAWDGSEAEKHIRNWATGSDGKIDFAKYKQAFAWYDSKNADKLGSYKLPHHDVKDGKLVVSKAGTIAAMAAVNGARGKGMTIDDADRKAAYNHLAKHYKDDLDMSAPDFKKDLSAELATKDISTTSIQTVAADKDTTNGQLPPDPAYAQVQCPICGTVGHFDSTGTCTHCGSVLGEQAKKSIALWLLKKQSPELALILKEGKVLSSDNLDHLMQAQQHVGAVISSHIRAAGDGSTSSDQPKQSATLENPPSTVNGNASSGNGATSSNSPAGSRSIENPPQTVSGNSGFGNGASKANAKRLQRKMIGLGTGGCADNYVPDSWEDDQDSLAESAGDYLADHGIPFDEDRGDSCHLLATFDDNAVVCVRNWSTDRNDCYQLDWTDGDDGPEWSGEPTEVSVAPSISEKALRRLAHKALHVAGLDRLASAVAAGSMGGTIPAAMVEKSADSLALLVNANRQVAEADELDALLAAN